jgi:fucose permease
MAQRAWLGYLIRFFLLSQGLIWNTFGPISSTCVLVYGWTTSDFALLANWGCLAFFVTLFPFNYVLEKRGIRCALLLALAMTSMGTALRLLPFRRVFARYQMHVCQVDSSVRWTMK